MAFMLTTLPRAMPMPIIPDMATVTAAATVTVATTVEPLKVACASCNLRELCLPVGLNTNELEQLDGLVDKDRKSVV